MYVCVCVCARARLFEWIEEFRHTSVKLDDIICCTYFYMHLSVLIAKINITLYNYLIEWSIQDIIFFHILNTIYNW